MLKSVFQFVKGYAWIQAVGAIIALSLLILAYLVQSPIFWIMAIILPIAIIIGIIIYILKKT